MHLEGGEREARIKRANKIFFDTVADVYEKVDRRRSEELSFWLDGVIEGLSHRVGGGSLLDVGSGTGLILRKAKRYFRHTYGVDLSSGMIREFRDTLGLCVCGDAGFLPFRDNSFDAVTCFALFHHCGEYLPVLNEGYRVLRRGGVLYTDHDLDARFMKLFYLPMRIYRKLFGMKRHYLNAKEELNEETYELAEYGSEGIKVEDLIAAVRKAGFARIEPRFHWLGLNRRVNRISILMKLNSYPRGLAPLFSLMAQK